VRVAGLIVCLGAAVFSTEINAQSPAPHPTAPGPAVQTVEAASLTNVVNIDSPWRFHAGDDRRFADPNFDDSEWPTIRPNQLFRSIGVPDITGGYLWARMHLRVPSTGGPFALAVYPAPSVQYEVFVNGSPIASTPGMATRTPRADSPFPVALPPSGDIVLAIRFYCGGGVLFEMSSSLPFTQVSIGSPGALQTSIELQRLRAFNNGPLADYACAFINLLIAITAIILYRSQRDHDEYLWLGIASLLLSLFFLFDIALGTGWLPNTRVVLLADWFDGYMLNAAFIEFFVRFTQIRRRWPIRIVQAAQLVPPLLLFLPNPEFIVFAGFLGLFLCMAAEAACVISAYRRGMPDARLFLIPAVVMILLTLAWGVALALPPGGVPWGVAFHFGPVGIAGNELGSMVMCLGIFAVVLFRFMRVARDEERAAAEFEAARTVQQILVPEEVPTIAGFSIEAVYQPAGQVGGDFYQVLPVPKGGLLAVIGDVSGKGMPAAMTVSLLVGTVRTLAHYTQDPAEILSAMNQRMVGRHSGFTTALVLRLDPDGTLTAANAGHIAPYANGKELEIDNSLPLGITAAVAYSNSTVHLEPAAKLTLLTDGVIEAQNEKGELFGFDRTAQISSQPAQHVAEAAQAFGQEDDITVLSLALVVGG
jgi:hypothetical protein